MLVSQAQQYDIPLNFGISQEVLQVKSEKDSLLHTGVRPYNQWFLSKQTFNNTFKDTGDYYYDFTVLLYQKHLLEIHRKDVHIGMDLLLDLSYGRRYSQTSDVDNKKLSTNTRGFRVVGNIGKNISFETRFYENQFIYPYFIDTLVDRRGIAPGIGRVKPFKEVGWDVGNSMGTVSWKMNDWFNLKFGHDKLFIGHGYRSLLLSDNASNYPYLALNLKSKNNKWQYMSTYAWMQSLSRSETTVSTEALFKRKNENFHYLSFKPNPHLEFGLFEGTIYKRYEDSIGFVNPHPSFYNPIIGVNTALSGLQGENNTLLGFSASYLKPSYQVFAQVAVDDLDRIGFQVGGKWFTPFGLERNWFLAEFNSVPSYMYSHSSANIFQNYTHMNQELAHPLGASFSEAVLLYHFYYDRWFADVQFNATFRKRGDQLQLGENIFRSSDNSLIEDIEYQNIQTYFWKIEGGYEFNIKTRLQFFGQVTQRILTNLDNSADNQRDFFFALGVRCNLNNFYLDL